MWLCGLHLNGNQTGSLINRLTDQAVDYFSSNIDNSARFLHIIRILDHFFSLKNKSWGMENMQALPAVLAADLHTAQIQTALFRSDTFL